MHFHITEHQQNLKMVLDYACRLAERAGKTENAMARQLLNEEAMLAWRAAQRLRKWRAR
jgi:hypothetical protein